MGEDYRFLTSLRCVRNDRCGRLRSEYVMRVATLTTWNESVGGLCVVTGLMVEDGFLPSQE